MLKYSANHRTEEQTLSSAWLSFNPDLPWKVRRYKIESGMQLRKAEMSFGYTTIS